MSANFLDILRCPICQSELSVEKSTNQSEKNYALIDEAGHRFVVLDGIPRFVGGDPETQKTTSLKSFNFQYGKEDWIFGYDAQRVNGIFENVFKIDVENIRSKKVIVIGCGNGPEVFEFAKMKPNCVIGVDLTDAIADAAMNTSEFDNVLIIQADATKPPLLNESMDVVYCDGVIPHTQDPKVFLHKILKLVKPDGDALIRTLLVPDSIYAKMHLFPRQLGRFFSKKLSSNTLWKLCYIGAVLNSWPIVGWLLRKIILYYDPADMSVPVTQLINFRMYGDHQFRHHLTKNEVLDVINTALPGCDVDIDGAAFRIHRNR